MRMIDADELKLKIVEEGQQSKRYKVGDFWELNRDEIWRAIDDLPTIEERKTGKWIRGKCDQCGAHAPFWPMASTYYESDYCPNCGSEMRGDDHETD